MNISQITHLKNLIQEYYDMEDGEFINNPQDFLVIANNAEASQVKTKTPKGAFVLGGRNTPPLPHGPAALRFSAFQ